MITDLPEGAKNLAFSIGRRNRFPRPPGHDVYSCQKPAAVAVRRVLVNASTASEDHHAIFGDLEDLRLPARVFIAGQILVSISIRTILVPELDLAKCFICIRDLGKWRVDDLVTTPMAYSSRKSDMGHEEHVAFCREAMRARETGEFDDRS